MKIRTGFVSNSSSSSFICDTCGESFEGMDLCARDVDHYDCENGHYFCDDQLFGDYIKDEDTWEIPEKNCPVCNFMVMSNHDMSKYLEKETGITREDVFAHVKSINKRRRVLRDYEYVSYVFGKNGLNEQDLLKEVKDKFKTYSKFNKYITGV